MDKQTLKKFKEILLKEKAELEARLLNTGKRDSHVKDREDFDPKFPNYGDKDDENAAEVATYGDNLSLEKTLESALADINKALDKIKKGTYGICNYCKELIDEKRLEARPTSSSCVNCKIELKNKA